MKQSNIVICLLALFIFFSTFAPSSAQTPPDIIRLHVLANSDAQADQDIKLQVRDAVLAALPLENLSAEDAKTYVMSHLDTVQRTARTTLDSLGCDDAVSVEWGVTDFPVRQYGAVLYPAGQYQALRVLLGDAVGRNWWCVLYPPLCYQDIAAATADDAQIFEIQPAHFRSRIADWWQSKQKPRQVTNSEQNKSNQTYKKETIATP